MISSKSKWRLFLILGVMELFSIGISSKEALGAQGAVVLRVSGCDYYVVETNMGYAILEWFGGNDPSTGDVLVGDYESYGMKDIHNLTVDSESRVWVEDYFLSKNRALEKLQDKCD